jgi:predicted PurR-regulated permease PerM
MIPVTGSRAMTPADPPSPARSAVAPSLQVAADWTWRLLVVAAGVYGLVKLFVEVSELVIPLLVALLVAALLHPLVDRMARGVPRPLATLAAIFGTLALLVGLFALVGQQTASGFSDLRTQAVAGLADVQHWLSTGPLHLSSTALQQYVTKAEDSAKSNQSGLLTGALGVASTLTKLLEGAFLTLFATFFFLSSGQRIWAWLLRMMPSGAQAPLDDAARSGWTTLSHYVRATLIVAVVDGLGIGIGALVLGVPLALPLGVAVFLGAFIPVVGALVTGILAVLVALVAQGPFVALAMLGVVILVNQIEAHGLQPFLLGRAVAVHPLAVILAIAAGAGAAGIVGALFAVPLVAVGNSMISSIAQRGRPDEGDEIAEDDAPLSPDKPAPTDLDEVPDTQRGAVSELPTGR